jgi:hypothetical protein
MPLRRSFAAREFNPAIERAGLDPRLTFRGLRRWRRASWSDDGVHPRVIQHRLGHATARLSQALYAKVSDAADKEAAGRVSAHGLGLLRARSGHESPPTTDHGTPREGRNCLRPGIL